MLWLIVALLIVNLLAHVWYANVNTRNLVKVANAILKEVRRR